MRIGIDVGRALHGRGGVAIYTRELVRALSGSELEGEIVCFDLDHETSDRADLQRALGPLTRQIRFERASRKALASLDLFHAPGFIMPRQEAPRFLFTLHDLTVVSLPECHTLENRARTLGSIVDALCRGATMLAVSQATRDEATRLLGLSAEEVEVLSPMLDPVFVPEADEIQDAETRQRAGIDGRYFLAVGSLEPRKNFGRLLEAWQSLPASTREQRRLVILAIAGWRQASFRSRLEDLSREGSLILLENPLSSSDLAALYRGAEALVFPSLAEGFGLPVAEAMACGTPVITSDRSSMPEVAGEAAILVNPDDELAIAAAIERLTQDSELARTLEDAGIERSQRYSREVALPRLLEIYRRVIDA